MLQRNRGRRVRATVPFPFRTVRFVGDIEIVSAQVFQPDFVQHVDFLSGECCYAGIVSKTNLVPLFLEMA
jgi:hypothetical protein